MPLKGLISERTDNPALNSKSISRPIMLENRVSPPSGSNEYKSFHVSAAIPTRAVGVVAGTF